MVPLGVVDLRMVALAYGVRWDWLFVAHGGVGV